MEILPKSPSYICAKRESRTESSLIRPGMVSEPSYIHFEQPQRTTSDIALSQIVTGSDSAVTWYKSSSSVI